MAAYMIHQWLSSQNRSTKGDEVDFSLSPFSGLGRDQQSNLAFHTTQRLAVKGYSTVCQPQHADPLSQDQSREQLITQAHNPLSFPFLWGLEKGFGWPKPGALCSPEVLAEGLLRWPNPAPAHLPALCWRDEEQTAVLQSLVQISQTSHHTDVPCLHQSELSQGQHLCDLCTAACATLQGWAGLWGEAPAPHCWQVNVSSAWRVWSICELGVGVLSAWFETNRQFLSQPSNLNLN